MWLVLFYGGLSSIALFFIYFGFAVCSLCFLLEKLIFRQVAMIMILYSYWLPQIYLNAQRGSARRVLSKEYVIGTTIARLFLPLYIWACPANILFKEPSRAYALLFAYMR